VMKTPNIGAQKMPLLSAPLSQSRLRPLPCLVTRCSIIFVTKACIK
jgi:hypothetical protein